MSRALLDRDPIGPADAAPGRLRLYLAWGSAGSHRAALVRALLGIAHALPVSYVDGPTLRREVYEVDRVGYDGPLAVPVLWDQLARQIVSPGAAEIDRCLIDVFDRGSELYPVRLRAEIDTFSEWIDQSLAAPLRQAVYQERPRRAALTALGDLDRSFERQPYATGEALTLADVRLWVHLVRYDAGPNAHGAVGPTLSEFEHLWAYALRLYRMPAFHTTTQLASFAAPFATLPPWSL